MSNSKNLLKQEHKQNLQNLFKEYCIMHIDTNIYLIEFIVSNDNKNINILSQNICDYINNKYEFNMNYNDIIYIQELLFRYKNYISNLEESSLIKKKIYNYIKALNDPLPSLNITSTLSFNLYDLYESLNKKL